MFTHQGRTFYVDPLHDGFSYAVYEQQDAWRRQDVDQVIDSHGIDCKRAAECVIWKGSVM